MQTLARQASMVFAGFVAVNAWWAAAAAWQWTVALAAVFTLYNLVLGRRRVAPGVGELLLGLGVCAGFTLLQAEYSAILYHLLLLRMALKAGRRRAVRVGAVVGAVYLAAATADNLAGAAMPGLVFNLIGIALLTYAASGIDALQVKQVNDDRRLLELMKQNDRNYRMALTDALTGLYNHRAYQEKMEGLGQAQYVLLIIDIDHFKRLNDSFGHLMGDKVLVTLGNIIKMSVRGGDLAFRYGGEEFVVVLPGTTPHIGLKIAERLRQKVAEWMFDFGTGRIPVTVSIGMAVKKPGMSGQAVFEQADDALYRAKQSGRNNVQSAFKPGVGEAAVKYGM
jgi:diguanylate cyclase (GGDEF)-like protein